MQGQLRRVVEARLNEFNQEYKDAKSSIEVDVKTRNAWIEAYVYNEQTGEISFSYLGHQFVLSNEIFPTQGAAVIRTHIQIRDLNQQQGFRFEELEALQIILTYQSILTFKTGRAMLHSFYQQYFFKLAQTLREWESKRLGLSVGGPKSTVI